MATLGGQAKETLKIAGTRLFVESAWGLRGKDAGGDFQLLCLKRCTRSQISRRVWSFWLLAYFDDSGMSLTIEQVVTQLQQEATSRWKLKLLIELDLQMQYVPPTISRQLEFGKTIRVSLTRKALVVRRSSLAREEDFQQWLKKTEAFFASVIQGVRHDVEVVR